VTTFSSHIHRMQQVIDLAARFGRKVALVGRSLVAHVGVARDLALLRVPDGTLVELAQARDLPRDRVTLLTAGSQAEAASALVRIAMDDHKLVTVEPGDAGARRVERVTAGRVFVDGGIGDVEGVVLRDRRHLSEDGLVLAVLAIHQRSGEIVAGPDLVSRGVVGEEASPEVLDAARGAVMEALAALNPESRTDPAEVKEAVRRALRRYFKRFDRRPVIL